MPAMWHEPLQDRNITAKTKKCSGYAACDPTIRLVSLIQPTKKTPREHEPTDAIHWRAHP